MDKHEILAVPQPYGKAPLFTPMPQKGGRVVKVGAKEWRIGVKDQTLDGLSNLVTDAFNINHAMVILGLFKYITDNGLSFEDPINISYRQLLEISGFPHNARTLKLIKGLISDLRFTTTAIWDPATGKTTYFNVIGNFSAVVDNETKRTTLKHITFSPDFLDMLREYDQFFNFHLSVWHEMTSKLAKVLYLYLPSRAVYGTEEKPYKTTIRQLLEDHNMTVPGNNSLQRKIFEQHSPSVLEQLDGKPVSLNGILRVKIEESESKINLCSWIDHSNVEYNPEEYTPGKLVQWWQACGGSLSEYSNKMKYRNRHTVTHIEIENLKTCGFNVEKSQLFLNMVKTLLLEGVFSAIVSTMKDLSLKHQLKSPGGFFVSSVKQELEKMLKQTEFQFNT